MLNKKERERRMKKKLPLALALQFFLLQGVCSAATVTENEEQKPEAIEASQHRQEADAVTSVDPKAYLCWGPVTASFGPAGMGFPVGKFAAVLNYRFIESEGMYLGNDKISDAVELTKNIGIVKFRYGIAPGLDIRTGTPLYNVEIKNLALGTENTKDGVGDTTAILHKVVMDQKKGDALSVAFDLGVTFPTATVNSDSIDFIGSQAWGVLTGVGFSYTKNSHRIDQEFNFAAFTEAEHDYQKPMRFRCNTTYAYALDSTFDMGIESAFEWNDEAKQYGEEMDDAYREWFVGPKVAVKMKKIGLFAGLGVLFPVSYEYDSASPSDDYRIEFKISKVF